MRDGDALNLAAGRGVAVREFALVLQSEKYSAGLRPHVPAPARPLPFLYQSTGVETRFTNRLDPTPKARDVFSVHRPDALADWLTAEPLRLTVIDDEPHPISQRPAIVDRATAPATRRPGTFARGGRA